MKMRELNICPSTLQEGFSTYSPTALKQLFDGQPVSHILDFDSPKDFDEFGRRIGLAPRLVNRELDAFAAEFPMVKELIDHSFLSDDLKRSYWLSYKYRRSTLV
jgi:hypothetical protein